MNLGSRLKSLSFCFLLNIQKISMPTRKSIAYKATAKEKSRLIILRRDQFLRFANLQESGLHALRKGNAQYSA